jgi:hypothetical protein
MSEASVHTPYSAEYLSLLARKGKLASKKIDNTWYTTKSALEDYMKKQMIRAQVLNGNYPTSNLEGKIPNLKPQTSDLIPKEEPAPKSENFPVPPHEVKLPIVTTLSLKQMRSFHDDIRDYMRKEGLPLPKEEEDHSTEQLLKKFDPEDPSYESRIIAPEYLPNIKQKNVVLAAAVTAQTKATKDVESALERVLDKKLGNVQHSMLNIGGTSIIPKKSLHTISKSKVLIGASLLTIAILTISPVPFAFSALENSISAAKKFATDANTVMGFRPGTHANQILLLDKGGNIAIMGHIETGSQLMSRVADGTAPMVVDSKTVVKNLNSEFIDGASTTDFTLAFITKNGAVTKENVTLGGSVTVGQTLLVRGAEKLLGELSVRGDLAVFGNAEFNQALDVLGPASFKGIISAESDINSLGNISSDGNITVKRNGSVRGSFNVGSALNASSGTFGALAVSGDFSAGGNVTLGASGKTLLFISKNATLDSAGNVAFSGAVSGSSLNLTGSATSTIAGPILFNGQVSFGGGGLSLIGTTTLENLLVTGSSSIAQATFINTTTTNATTTNLFASALTGLFARITSIVASDISVGALTSTSTIAINATSTNATSTNSVIQNLVAANSLLTNATTTNSTITNASITSASIAYATSTNATSTNLFSTTGTFNNVYVNNYQQNNGTFAINSTVPTGDIFSVLDNAITSGTLIHQTLTANAGNGQVSNGQVINLIDSTIAGGGYSALTINASGAGTGSGNKYLLDLNPGASTDVVFDSTGAFRPTTAANINTNSIGTPSYYWKSGYFDTITANTITGTLAAGGTSSHNWTLGTTEAGDFAESLIFQRNSGSGNATLGWNASSGVQNDQRFLSVNYPFNATYTVNDASISTSTSLYSGLLTNNTTSGTQKLLSLTNTGTGSTENGIYINNTGTGLTAFEIAGTWTTGIKTNNNSIDAGTGGLTFGNATGTNATTTNFNTTNLTATNSVLTNATSTNFNTSNITYTTGSGSTLLLTSLLTAGNLLATGSSTLQNFTAQNSTSTNATTTNFFATNSVFTNLIAGSQTITNLLYTNATGTNSTTTNSYSTTASSTKLFASVLNIGNNALLVTSAGNVGLATTTPNAKLEIFNSLGSTPGLRVAGSDPTNARIAVQNYNGNNFEMIAGITGSTNSGFTIRDVTNVADRITITNIGNVGIGITPTTTSKLAVAGNIDTTDVTLGAMRVYDGTTFRGGVGTGRWASGVIGEEANYAVFATGNLGLYAGNSGVPKINILSGGNVGIGNTNPGKKLDVSGDIQIRNGGNLYIGDTTSNGSPSINFAGSSSVTNWQLRQNNAVAGDFTITPSTTGGGSTFTTPALSILSGGNVGIGVTNPGTNAKFEVNGTGGPTLNGGPTYAIFSDYSSATLRIGNDGASNIRIGTDGAQALKFYPGGSNSMTLLSNGNVGIGTTAPLTPLDVQGIITTRSASPDNPAAPAESIRMAYTGTADSSIYRNSIYNEVSSVANTGLMQFRVNNGGSSQATVMSLSGNGNAGIGITNPTYKLDVSTSAGGSKLFRAQCAGCVPLYGYGDSGGSGVTNSDPYTSGALLYMNGTTQYFYTGSTVALTLAGGNVSTSGTITSGLINGQTISSAANFTGTLRVGTYGLVSSPAGSYGTLALGDAKSGWYGINMANSAANATLMYDGSGNGGIYYETGALWEQYFLKSTQHLNIMTSADLGATLGVSGTGYFSGAVGIGTSVSSYKLDVMGTAWNTTQRLNSSTGSVGSDYFINSSTRSGVVYGDTSGFGLLTNAGGWAVQIPVGTSNVNVYGGNLQIAGTTVIDTGRNLTNIGTITAAGNVGFGLAAGAYRLSVGGTPGNWSTYINSDNASGYGLLSQGSAYSLYGQGPIYGTTTITAGAAITAGTNFAVGNHIVDGNQDYCAGGITCYYNWSGSGVTNVGNSTGATVNLGNGTATVTGGTYNGQTISSAANFTGQATVGTYLYVGNDVLTSGAVRQKLGGYIYPGSISGLSDYQSSYFIASHASWGLYSNTSFDANGGLYDAGSRVCSASTCSIGSANVITSGGISASGYVVAGTAFQLPDQTSSGSACNVNGKLVYSNNSATGLVICAGGLWRVPAFGSYTNPDLAEYVPVQDESISAGELVAVSDVPNPNGSAPYDRFYAERATAGNATKVLGIISTDPGLVLNKKMVESSNINDVGKETSTAGLKPLALAGRVPVKVTMENGSIAPGDFLTISDTIPGRAMKATVSGEVIGKVLSPYDASTGTVLVYLEQGFQMIGGVAGLTIDVGTATSSMMSLQTFASTTIQRLNTLESKVLALESASSTMASSTSSWQAGLTMDATSTDSITHSILATLGASVMNGITHFGDIVVSALTIGSHEKPAGVTFYDSVTGEPYCFKISNGAQVSVPGVCGTATTTTPSAPTSSSTPPIASASSTPPADTATSTPPTDTSASTTPTTTASSTPDTATSTATSTTP